MNNKNSHVRGAMFVVHHRMGQCDTKYVCQKRIEKHETEMHAIETK